MKGGGIGKVQYSLTEPTSRLTGGLVVKPDSEPTFLPADASLTPFPLYYILSGSLISLPVQQASLQCQEFLGSWSSELPTRGLDARRFHMCVLDHLINFKFVVVQPLSFAIMAVTPCTIHPPPGLVSGAWQAEGAARPVVSMRCIVAFYCLIAT